MAAAPSNYTLALLTDTHYWHDTPTRQLFASRTGRLPERDGLLVHRSPQIIASVLQSLAGFASSGGTAAIHIGDAGCGGGGFDQPAIEHAASLQTYRAMESSALARHDFRVHHIPGNHDLSPSQDGGLGAWYEHLGPSQRVSATTSAMGAIVQPRAYRSLHLGTRWKVLLLDSTDGVQTDRDGHGHIGRVQLSWLEAELQSAERQRQHVILCMHQLLIDPSGADTAEERRTRYALRSKRRANSIALDPTADMHGGGPSWIGEGDMIDNRASVLEVLSRYASVVRLSLHGHVHANTRALWRGIEFISLASTTEYPMEWFELRLSDCTAHLLPRPVEGVDEWRDESLQRETRPRRNDIKRGGDWLRAATHNRSSGMVEDDDGLLIEFCS